MLGIKRVFLLINVWIMSLDFSFKKISYVISVGITLHSKPPFPVSSNLNKSVCMYCGWWHWGGRQFLEQFPFILLPVWLFFKF